MKNHRKLHENAFITNSKRILFLFVVLWTVLMVDQRRNTLGQFTTHAFQPQILHRSGRGPTSNYNMLKNAKVNSPNNDHDHDIDIDIDLDNKNGCEVHGGHHKNKYKAPTIDNIERIFAISDLHTDNVSNLELLQTLCLKQQKCANNINHDHNSSNNSIDVNTTTINNYKIGPNDAIIIAGDVSHELSKLRETLTLIQNTLQCQIFFIWGNHEAWIGGQEMDSLHIKSSLQKIKMVKKLCHELGGGDGGRIHTECKLVGCDHANPVFILPIESWYDATLSLEDCEDLCMDFKTWRWVDFIRCEWPEEWRIREMIQGVMDDEDGMDGMDEELDKCNEYGCENNASDELDEYIGNIQNTGRIPLGLTEFLYHENEKTIKEVRRVYNEWVDKYNPDNRHGTKSQNNDDRKENITNSEKTSNNNKKSVPGLITYSHFLPNQKTLPDWKEPNTETFKRKEWLDHPVPDISAKFAKVAGSILIDTQIRKIIPSHMQRSLVQHLHVFGHSHRPKDFVYDDIRYIHNPLGKPAEREMNMVSQDVGFQLIWDCTKQSSQIGNEKSLSSLLSIRDDNNGVNDNITNQRNEEIKGTESLESRGRSSSTAATTTSLISSVGTKNGSWGGEIPGTQVIRYWEEQGGGKKVLERKMKHRRKRRRVEVKRFVRDLELTKNTKDSSSSSNSD